MELTKDQVTEQIKLVARYRKAKKIALKIVSIAAGAGDDTQTTLETVQKLGQIETGRKLAAEAAGVNVPSVVTWALVIEMVTEILDPK